MSRQVSPSTDQVYGLQRVTRISLALKGRRFEGWADIENAIACATAYWNDHRHPFIWGRRRRHRQSQRLGIAAVPNLTLI